MQTRALGNSPGAVLLSLAWFCLHLGHAAWSSHATEPPPIEKAGAHGGGGHQEREMMFHHGMSGPDVAYHIALHGDARYTQTSTLIPAVAYLRGGIAHLDARGMPNFLNVSTDVAEIHRQGAGHQGTWIYQVATGPHMVNVPPGANEETRRYLAIGAIFWSQVMAFAVTTGADTAEDLVWQPNPGYDATWAEFGASPWQPMFGRSSTEHERRAQAAVFYRLASDTANPHGEFINELTGDFNPTLNHAQRQTLRTLLHWYPPWNHDRSFPILAAQSGTYMQSRLTS